MNRLVQYVYSIYTRLNFMIENIQIIKFSCQYEKGEISFIAKQRNSMAYILLKYDGVLIYF